MLQLPKTSPCSLNLFSPPNCCHSLPSVLDFSLPVLLITWIYLLPSIFFLFSSSPTIPSKVIFFSSSKKIHIPIYLIILCDSMPNTLSFSHWCYVPKETKWSVLALTYCTFPGMKNATALLLRKITPIPGLCAHKAGKPTFLREQHLTSTSLLSSYQKKNSFSSLQTTLLPALAKEVGSHHRSAELKTSPVSQQPTTNNDNKQCCILEGINTSED